MIQSEILFKSDQCVAALAVDHGRGLQRCFLWHAASWKSFLDDCCWCEIVDAVQFCVPTITIR